MGFFRDVGEDSVGVDLMRRVGGEWKPEQTVGVWKFDLRAWEEKRRPYRGGLRPDNEMGGAMGNDTANGFATSQRSPASGKAQAVNGLSNEPLSDRSTPSTATSANDKVLPPIPA